eukprot:TRINITY_DN12130_c0_g1_i4.p1 TRINITY_DN12130_c0_g1~~TRINITY_DN12130_c0_g1_i4.p1  ORF type:complete len:606 (+),score=155.79 TRINITY_DN12130_c0_g1_i4:216-1820(+)
MEGTTSTQLVTAKAARQTVQRANKAHMNRLATQLLQKQGLSLEWKSHLLRLAYQVQAHLRPNVAAGDQHDVRAYVKIRCLSGKTMADSSYHSGVMFTKNVAHKKMATRIQNPRILVLSFALEFSPRGLSKYASLETVTKQERTYLEKHVRRIARLQPNVVIAQRGVARIALDLIQAQGITLIINVKDTVVSYIARCTQATILHNIEELNVTPRLGHCKLFELREFTLANGDVKTLAVFDGCAPSLGCTIVLRGGDEYSELIKVKSVLRFLCFAAYHLHLEAALYNEECAYLPDEEFLAGLERKAQRPSLHLQLATVPSEDPEGSNGETEMLVAVNDADGQPGDAVFDNLTLSPKSESQVVALPAHQAQLPFVIVEDLSQDDKHGWDQRCSLFNRLRDDIILSISPSVQLKAPFLYTDEGRKCPSYDLLPHIVHWSPLLFPASTAPQHASDCMDIEHHQSIDLLYSLTRDNDSGFCLEPQVITLNYYAHDDLTLGYYLEQMCLNADYQCPGPECDLPVERHDRIFAHGSAQIKVG